MQPIADSHPTEAEAPCSEYALRIAGPADRRLEVSIDGSPYRPCRYADGYWWHYWSGAVTGGHHMVVIVRSAV